jgi:N-acetylglucosaminyldiphosphoundecaprenol N-acetyl-beta-D-mannosaminyltransferase
VLLRSAAANVSYGCESARMNQIKTEKILDVAFTTSAYKDIKRALDVGALMVVPSGPGLASIEKKTDYHEALRYADFALFDSGCFVLLCRIFGVGSFKKYSGYAFIKDFFGDTDLRDKHLMLVDPSDEESQINADYIRALGLNLKITSYVAPRYDKLIRDNKLACLLQKEQPDFLMINIGGGVQEILGAWLKKEIGATPGIICTGAAIAFLTGMQAPMTKTIDKLYLGWLIRILHAPLTYTGRYFAAIELVFVMWKKRKYLRG